MLLTKYSKTRVSERSVCMMSCKVTMLACFKSRNKETETKCKRSSDLDIDNEAVNNFKIIIDTNNYQINKNINVTDHSSS